MKIQSHSESCNLIEYSLDKFPDNEESRKWEKFIKELIINIVDSREIALYINGYNKKSFLNDYKQLIINKYKKVKYGFVPRIDVNTIHEIIDESEFYLGEVYLLIGDLSEEKLQSFVDFINFQSKIICVPPIECISMGNDGLYVYWAKPIKHCDLPNFEH